MNDKNELRHWHDLEEEYENIFEEFENSTEEQTFSKSDVIKIIEAHLFKEIIEHPKRKVSRSRARNLLVTTKDLGARFLSVNTLLKFVLSYLFNIGFLLVIDELIYPNMFKYKSTVFIIAIVFTLVERIVKPYLFIADLLSFTLLKFGLVTLAVFTSVGYFSLYFLNEQIPFEKVLIMSLIVLVLMAVLEFIKKDSIFKTNYVEGEGNVDDEQD